MHEGERKVDLEELIFRYKFWIGGVLLFLIMVGFGILLWRENYWKPGIELGIRNYELRIKDLELKIAESEKEMVEKVVGVDNSKAENESEKQFAERGAEGAEGGNVAGANTNSASDIKIQNSPKETAKPAVLGKVNINMATAEQLDALPGIGPVYAKRIVEYRASKGLFKSIDDIKNVQGIGEKTFLKFSSLIGVE